MTAPWSPMRALAAFDPNGWSLARGIRGALGCCVPLLRGPVVRQSGAVLGGVDRLLGRAGRSRLAAAQPPVDDWRLHRRQRSRLRRRVLLRPYLWPSGAFALVWCFAAILTRVWGDTAGSAGKLTALATLMVLGADRLPLPPPRQRWPLHRRRWALGLLLAFGIGRGVPRRRCAPRLRQCSKPKPRSCVIWRAPDRRNSAAARCGKRSRTPASCWLPRAAAGSAAARRRNASRYCWATPKAHYGPCSRCTRHWTTLNRPRRRRWP